MDRVAGELVDGHGRRIDYLRLSVLEQCQMRCFYCHPGRPRQKKANPRLPAARVIRLAAAFVGLGVRRVRLTGGEPLLRCDLEEIAAGISTLDGIEEVTLSTNAELLAPRAAALRTAGVGRVNVSLDSLDRATFARITGGGCLDRVVAGIDAALAAGLRPVKLNSVVMRGINDHEIGALLGFAREREVDLRFIETMPIGPAGADSSRLLVPADEILAAVRAHCGGELVPLLERRGGGPARYYRLDDGTTVGVISAMSRHFCADCIRVRLSACGDLQLCLGRPGRVGLGQLLADGASDLELQQAICQAIGDKPYGHDFADPATAATLEMTAIGG
ncbi:MAG TPA: GTP 3',8-cyclase MoaA [Gammaproteobacteria bacterium]